jgi:adenine phosphoribosyltransferase
MLGGTIVGLSFLIELSFLKGRTSLGSYDVFSLIEYDAE